MVGYHIHYIRRIGCDLLYLTATATPDAPQAHGTSGAAAVPRAAPPDPPSERKATLKYTYPGQPGGAYGAHGLGLREREDELAGE